MPPPQYRRCPECQVALRASSFSSVTNPTPEPGSLGAGQRERLQCPECEFIGPRAAFLVVDQPARGDSPA
jgi:rubredoxin